MSVRGEITDEMRRRFEDAERTCVAETPLSRPALRPSEASLRAHFTSEAGLAQAPLANPHLEPRVSAADRARAVPAAVLLCVVLRETGPTLLVTLRPAGISYPGHWVFPGGRCEPGDATPIESALRETREEVGLEPGRVEVLGRLGDYTSHSGFRIAPVVALVSPPFSLRPRPAEVEAVAEIELTRALDPNSYFLYRFPDRSDRAHFALEGGADGLVLTGVTASLAIGLYSELTKTHAPSG